MINESETNRKPLPKIRVIFSDTKEVREAWFDVIRFDYDHVELTNVIYTTFDGVYNWIEKGVIYFEAVDRIEIIRDGSTTVAFSKTE